jgi:hypothetical protein
MEKEKTSVGTWIVFILIVSIIIGSSIFIVSALSGGSIGTKWTLMVCDEVMDNGVECSSIYRTQELQSKDACMRSGRATQNSHPVFECGRGCKYDGNFWTCNEICNVNGLCH